MLSFDGLNFEQSESTSYIHDGVKMTEYENEPFIIGDYKHNQVEFMHSSHEKWYTAHPFPRPNLEYQGIFGYATVSRPGKVFLLGGCCDDNWSQIALFENDEWNTDYGRLKHGRINFMTITYGTDVMIIGGRTFQNQS